MDDEEVGVEISKLLLPINFSNIPGFPNSHYGENLTSYLPIIHGHGNDDLSRLHIMDFLKVLDDSDIVHEDIMILMFASSLNVDAYYWFIENIPDRCITSLSSFFRIFLIQWYFDGTNMEKFLRNAFAYFLPDEKLYLEASKQHEHLMRNEETTFFTLERLFLKEEPLHEDPIEETCEEPLIEDIVKDSHVFMEVSDCPQYYFSEEDDHIGTTDLAQEETFL